jgi:hypothetical protein
MLTDSEGSWWIDYLTNLVIFLWRSAMPKRLVVQLTLFTILISACAAQTPAPENPGGPSAPELIGKISRVSDTVQHNQTEVSGTNDLFQNDSLRMFNGGEGLLDFGSDLRLRMFNDTELGGVRTSNDPDAPLIGKLTLFAGGFSGQLFRDGGRFEFDTPNGAQIHVYGTTFIIVYDHVQQETIVVNFDGDVRVEAAGSGAVAIRPGDIYSVQVDQEPVLIGQVPWTPGEYEQLARSYQSALTPFDEILPITGETTPEQVVQPPPSKTAPLQVTQLVEAATPEPSKTFTPIPPSRTPTPTKTQVRCPPAMTVIKNAWCREGPSQVYKEIDSFVVGEFLEVQGRNNDESWWWVRKHSRGNCWISSVAVDKEGDSSCLDYIKPPPTYTPTPTITVTPSATSCPMMAMKYFNVMKDPYSVQRTLTWKVVGGCGPYSGTLTAEYQGEGPYLTQQISGNLGNYDDSPPSRCEGTFNIIYRIKIVDGTGQVVNDSITVEITWIC